MFGASHGCACSVAPRTGFNADVGAGRGMPVAKVVTLATMAATRVATPPGGFVTVWVRGRMFQFLVMCFSLCVMGNLSPTVSRDAREQGSSPGGNVRTDRTFFLPVFLRDMCANVTSEVRVAAPAVGRAATTVATGATVVPAVPALTVPMVTMVVTTATSATSPSSPVGFVDSSVRVSMLVVCPPSVIGLCVVFYQLSVVEGYGCRAAIKGTSFLIGCLTVSQGSIVSWGSVVLLALFTIV